MKKSKNQIGLMEGLKTNIIMEFIVFRFFFYFYRTAFKT